MKYNMGISRANLVAALFLILLYLSEIIEIFSLTLSFIVLIILILFLLIQLAQNTQNNDTYKTFIAALLLIPTFQLTNSILPLNNIPDEFKYLAASLPNLFTFLIIISVTQLSLADIGFNRHKFWLQILIGLTGLFIGIVQYIYFKPLALAVSLELNDIILPILVIFIATGLVEELIFRGLLLSVTTKNLGSFIGIAFSTFIYVLLQVKSLSLPQTILVILIALFYAWIANASQNIIGVIISHSLANGMTFIILPLLLNS